MDPSLYRAFYEAEERHWWFVGRRAVIDGFLARSLGAAAGAPAGRGGVGEGAPGAPRRILDVGCGTGGMLPLLARYGQVTGVDSEPLALDYCRRRGFSDVHLQVDFEPRPVFDLVTLFDVLEHVGDEPAFLEQVARNLGPDGRLAVTVPAFRFLWSGHDDLNQHRRRYTRGMLVGLLARCGFQVSRASYFNTLLFPAALVRPLGRRRPGPPPAGGRASAPENTGRRGAPAEPGDAGGLGDANGLDRAREEILRPLRPGPLDAPLAAIFGFERHLLRAFDLPFGVSLFAIAARRGGAG